MSSQPSTTALPDRDERLARLLSEMTEKARHGQPIDVGEIARNHPDLGEELRELWAAVQFAEEFTRPAATLKIAGSPIGPIGPMGPQESTSESPEPAPAVAGRSFGDFDLLEEIGRGGMGVVYRAWQKSLNRMVALKMILRGEHATPADVARFQVEAQAAAHLEHPNIVPVYAAGVQDGQEWFCMRFVEGETLSSLLSRGPLRSREAAAFLATIAGAVAFAHQRGILHRDLKPSNILIDCEGQPLITDFGLAKRVSGAAGVPSAIRPTLSGSIVGTPAYMAPEQVTISRGKPSPVSDVYSLGIILYEMLTGRPPFQAPTPVDTMFLVLEQDPVRPRLLNPKVDPDLELICLKCIQKDPELRYDSAAALDADLNAFLQGGTLSVRGGSLRDLAGLFKRIVRETHHAVILENWGMLWMIHSAMILLICVATFLLRHSGFTHPLYYLVLWGGGLIVWGGVFWSLRKRAGPILFVERQVAHVWAGAVVATISVFVVEIMLGLPVLRLTPILAVIAGMTFVVKAGMLSGWFYLWAALQFLSTIPIARWPDIGPLIFGGVTAVSFFIPGMIYHRQRKRTLREQREAVAASL
jgi:serine/threonine-protein kinase